MIDRETEAKLVAEAQAGNEKAAAALVEAHMPLIRSISRKMGSRLEEEDAIAYGIMGFLQGLPRYEIESGFRVNTFVRHYIAEGVRTATSKAPLVRFARTKDTVIGLNTINEMIKAGELVTPETLSKKTGFSDAMARGMIAKHTHNRSTTYESVNDALDVEDSRPHPDAAIEMAQRRAILSKATSVLTERELDIFSRRTAATDTPLTLEELGDFYGVSRERIRQIEVKALGKVQRQLARMGLAREDLKADLKAA